MQNGSLDGRIVGSFPVKNSIPEDYDDYDDTEEEDTQNPGGGGKGILRPATEYFRVGNNSDLVLTLQQSPFTEEARYGANRSTIHIYWNNVFQKDASFILGGKVLYLRDPRGVLQADDTITVKYWWTEGGGGGPGPPVVVTAYHMEGWFTGGLPYRRFGGVGGEGLAGGLPGSNGGGITTFSTLYSTVGFLSHFYAALRLPQGQTIDLDNVIDVDVLIRFPMNANVGCFGYSNSNGKPGNVIVRKIECGLGGEVQGTVPPDHAALPEGEIKPGPPLGGNVLTHTGGAGVSFAQLANVEVDFDGNHQTIPIIMSDGGPNGSNSGCAGFGDPTFFDDTIYGKFTMHENVYDGSFGATIIVMQEATED